MKEPGPPLLICAMRGSSTAGQDWGNPQEKIGGQPLACIRCGSRMQIFPVDQHTPKPVPEKAARKIMTRVIRKARVAHPFDLGMVSQELCHGKRVRAVALNA